jgi:hypothetical protein
MIEESVLNRLAMNLFWNSMVWGKNGLDFGKGDSFTPPNFQLYRDHRVSDQNW